MPEERCRRTDAGGRRIRRFTSGQSAIGNWHFFGISCNLVTLVRVTMDVTALLRQKTVGSSLSVRTRAAQAVNPNIPGRRHNAMGVDDAELARRVAQNDREAAAALVTRYQASLRTFLGRICTCQEAADDLAQETFIRMLRYAHRYDGRYPMKTWLFTIARRLLINHLRDSGRMHLGDGFDAQPSAHARPDELASRNDQQHWTRGMLRQAMAELPEAQRQVLMLFYHQDQSIDEIARTMQMPHGTVKSHLHRARAALRTLLAPQREAMEP